jgi:hypothetical protein
VGRGPRTGRFAAELNPLACWHSLAHQRTRFCEEATGRSGLPRRE